MPKRTELNAAMNTVLITRQALTLMADNLCQKVGVSGVAAPWYASSIMVPAPASKSGSLLSVDDCIAGTCRPTPAR